MFYFRKITMLFYLGILPELVITDQNMLISVISSAAFQGYDIVIYSENERVSGSYFGLLGPAKAILTGYQVLGLKSKADLLRFTRRSNEAKLYGRTLFCIFPGDLESLSSYVDEVAPLYLPGLGTPIDTRLYVFIIWPTELNGIVGKQELEFLRRLSLKFRLNSEVYILFQTVLAVQVYEFYSIGDVSIVQEVSPCWESLGPECYILAQRFERRKNFQGGIVRATAVDHVWDQCVASYRRTNETLEFVGGISVEALFELGETFNFTIRAMESNAYIWVQPDGFLGGVGGQVFFGDADISITLEYLLEDRMLRLSPLFPLFMDKARAYYRQPVNKKDIFTHPFTENAWKGIAGAALLILGVVVFLNWLNYRLHSEPWYSSESIFFIFAVVAQKGWHFDPPSIPGKIVLFTALAFSSLCFIGYSSTIMATLKVDVDPVKSFRHLMKMGFKIMFHFDQAYLFVANLGVVGTSTGIPANSNYEFSSESQAVGRVAEGGYAFLTTTDIFRPLSRIFYMHENTCSSISSLAYETAPLPSCFYVKKGSPYKDHFNTRLLQRMQNGLNFRYKKFKYATEEVVTCTILDNTNALEMDELVNSFIILIVGTAASVIFLWIECIVSSSNRLSKPDEYGISHGADTPGSYYKHNGGFLD